MYKILVGYSVNSEKYFLKKIHQNGTMEFLTDTLEKDKCIKQLQKHLLKNCVILKDFWSGTSGTHQMCIRLIIDAIDGAGTTDNFGGDELLEFHCDKEKMQFIIARHALSKAMISNNDDRTVDALLDDYYNDSTEALYIYDIMPDSEIFAKRNWSAC